MLDNMPLDILPVAFILLLMEQLFFQKATLEDFQLIKAGGLNNGKNFIAL